MPELLNLFSSWSCPADVPAEPLQFLSCPADVLSCPTHGTVWSYGRSRDPSTSVASRPRASSRLLSVPLQAEDRQAPFAPHCCTGLPHHGEHQAVAGPAQNQPKQDFTQPSFAFSQDKLSSGSDGSVSGDGLGRSGLVYTVAVPLLLPLSASFAASQVPMPSRPLAALAHTVVVPTPAATVIRPP